MASEFTDPEVTESSNIFYTLLSYNKILLPCIFQIRYQTCTITCITYSYVFSIIYYYFVAFSSCRLHLVILAFYSYFVIFFKSLGRLSFYLAVWNIFTLLYILTLHVPIWTNISNLVLSFGFLRLYKNSCILSIVNDMCSSI